MMYSSGVISKLSMNPEKIECVVFTRRYKLGQIKSPSLGDRATNREKCQIFGGDSG